MAYNLGKRHLQSPCCYRAPSEQTLFQYGTFVPLSLVTPLISDWDNGVSDLDNLGFQPSLGRVSEYLDWFGEHATEEINREKALSQVETGHGGLLIALLFAKCPRLRDLKLISIPKGVRPERERSQRTGSEYPSDSDETAEEHEDVAEIRENYERMMVPQEMERMEICKDNEACEQFIEQDCTQDDKMEPMDDNSLDVKVSRGQCPDGFVSLRFVAIGVASDTWMDDDRYPCSCLGLRRPPKAVFVSQTPFLRSSEVRIGRECPRNVLRGPAKAAPRSVTGRDADDLYRASRIARNPAGAQGSSLKSLIWYGFDSNSISSDDCSVDFWENAGSGECGDKAGETVLLERVIFNMIESGRYKNLKAIFLEEVEHATDRGKGTVSFKRAVAAGKAKGVKVYTRINGPVRHGIEFPEPVKHYRHQPSDTT
ncbi:hypothetical protein BU25DRAFT_444295 [Macroventuria anomochaeta]|uniref:Uncharacterized protein n=1 Tax=Macroventuria anomochaeta TaxID=301207 RepID=A0ACB6SH90_9PLEO|nr:uncharacterized protein BU25DRAFT_444295 [Macroventuria anomochaeta]KAF2633601.1 hypothetical protein BU25DRAFT_444295 [Macroventuria anomochaeta]